jgi:Flp pilus assembly protein TadD
MCDAFIGLGRSLLAGDHIDQAIEPLARATKLEPDNPSTHYYMALALAKASRKADADREMALYKETSAKAQKQKDDLNVGIVGPQAIEAPKPQ